MEQLPGNREDGLRRYSVWISLELVACKYCACPIVFREDAENGNLDTVTGKWIETRTVPCYGLWFIGVDHTADRCQQFQSAS
jgi:hypothetical protein